MQFTINGEQADALASVFAEQMRRVDIDDDGLGAITFTKQGLDGALVVAFAGDGRTFEISGGGTVEGS